MRILIAVNLTLYREGKYELDTGFHYLYEPLVKLGHEVYFYDTVRPIEADFDKIVSEFSPDLVFCCFTGNRMIAPHEPWDSIRKLTEGEKVKTFNWFCDDTWRFDDFSSKACWNFNYCSTPEPSYISKFKDIGYKNILLGAWYVNSDYYPSTEKDIEISFVGGMNKDRQEFFDSIKVPVTLAKNLTIEQLFNFYCRSKIGINLSINANDPEKKTQMKQRVFELAAANCVVLTEDHSGLHEFFEEGKEMVTFSNKDEFEEKVNFLLSNPEESKEIALNGYNRFIKDHESKVRLSNLLEEIFNES